MNARYNSVICVILAVVITPLAWGGGLNRIAVTGPTGVGNGSDPDGPWLPENLGSKIQIRDTQLEFGTEIMIPKFTYENKWGRKWKSKNIVHPLPYLSYGRRLDEDTVVGLEISTEYGLGASFQKIYGAMDSQTLVSGTYIKPYVAQRLSDHWSIGVSLMIVNAQLAWRGPLDVNRIYFPIGADTRVTGFGLGAAAGVFYQPTDNLAFGVNYTSSVKAHLSGRTEIFRPFHLRDRVQTDFQFPDKWELSAAWKPTDRWLIVADWTFYGYSKNSLESVDIKFDKLLITKPVNTGWADNFAVRLGTSYKFTDRLTVGGGIGYMSKAIPDKTADFMTPDVGGYCVAGRVKYKVSDSFDLTAGLSRGWGSNKDQGREMTADVWTVALSGTIRF